MDWLHHFLNFVLFSPNGDLAWAGVRAVTATASLITAINLRHTRGWLFAATLFLAIWIGLKVADDVVYRQKDAQLTVYFLLSNLAWVAILLSVSREVATRRGKK